MVEGARLLVKPAGMPVCQRIGAADCHLGQVTVLNVMATCSVLSEPRASTRLVEDSLLMLDWLGPLFGYLAPVL
jgi:hypothetical protein